MNILEHNNDKINGVLEPFERMIINGYLLCLQSYRLLLYYLIQKNVRLKDFNPFALQQTNSLCSHIEEYLKQQNVPLQYLNSGKLNKDDIARAQWDKCPSKTGLIAALSAVEVCNTMTVHRSTQKLEVASRPAKCKHYYFYFNDDYFGWMFLKIQTWFPYNIQIYINGRECLSKALDKQSVAYQRYFNSFCYIEDFNKAQEIADKILDKKLSDSFDAIVKPLQCLLPDIQETMSHCYYWCIDQCEFATERKKQVSSNYKRAQIDK